MLLCENTMPKNEIRSKKKNKKSKTNSENVETDDDKPIEISIDQGIHFLDNKFFIYLIGN
jgi:hypothetical protein